MKKFLLIISAVAFVFNAFAQSNFAYKSDYQAILVETKNEASELSYDKLIRKYKTQDPSLSSKDVLSLMIGHTDRMEYRSNAYSNVESAVRITGRDGTVKDIYTTAKSFLNQLPFSLSLLNQLMFTSKKLGLNNDAEIYRKAITHVTEAMKLSGDGLSPETAIFILESRDASFFLGELRSKGYIIGAKNIMDKGDYFEVYEYQKRENGPTYNFYFNLNHSVKKKITKL